MINQNKNTDGNKNNTDISGLTKENATESNALTIPKIELPKGGGALKGIDEKFEVNAANGTANFSIPLPLSPGRNGFTPSLALSYNSGGGNSPYGLGWSVDYPAIQRKTDKRLPRYRDGLEEDIFLFSGAEDLVPCMEKKGGTWEEKEYPGNGDDGYWIKQYRPRIEGIFARIEKIYHADYGTYWKVTTRENITTIFGQSKEARIADPEDVSRIFQWMPEFSYDDKGNWMQYHYKQDTNIDKNGSPLADESIPALLFETNRKSGVAPYTNTYLKKITYGNKSAYYANVLTPYDPQTPDSTEYFFELVMDYGEHHLLVPTPEEVQDWDYRPDPFSSYRSGFEIRTNRLCKRILMFHHFNGEKQFVGTPDEGDFGENYLVRSMNLTYEPSSINDSGQTEVSYLASIAQYGYIRKPSGEYSVRSLPPVEFTYQNLHWNKKVKTVDKEAIVNAPVGLTNNYQWVDLYGEGISGIFTEQAEGWYYKSNLGDPDNLGKISFSTAQKVLQKPSFTGFTNGKLSLQDLNADGNKQIVVKEGGMQGFFEIGDKAEWEPFMPFQKLVTIDFNDPNTRLIDLTGDGQPDIVISEEHVFVWYASDGKKGHKPAEKTLKTFEEEQGPAVVFADQLQTIFLADMSGDGLTDIVRIRNGEICYWANMGYGKFSSKISMENAPAFDHPDLFNPQYIHMADVSGTGATDIIYLGKNHFRAFINYSGNAWSLPFEIDPSFPFNNNNRLSVVDLLGTGTSCIVWSSDLPEHAETPMRYIDLMDSKKPHVLVGYRNNMGKETSFEYKSSTYFYLKDKREGNPWITKLPFPVQVVSKFIVEEKITDVRFSTLYHYHHGYYDSLEREFRGFGMVEQLDSEHYKEWEKNNLSNRLDSSEILFQKPVLTKTWFHTGAFLERERILHQFENEYWPAQYTQKFPSDPILINEPKLTDANVDDEIKQLKGKAYREAIRACKSMILRQEIFALEASEDMLEETLRREKKPYTVTTRNCNIQQLQPRSHNYFGVFLVTENETVTIHYERNITDPRIAHTLNLKIDDLGNILESASVVYPRQIATMQHPLKLLEDAAEALNYKREDEKDAYKESLSKTRMLQAIPNITYTINKYTNDIDRPEVYRLRQLADVQTFEITGLEKANQPLLKAEDFDMVFDKPTLEYHMVPPTSELRNRLIEHIQTSFYNETLDDELAIEVLPSHGIIYQSYQLAYTNALLNDIYGDKLPNTDTALENIMGSLDQDSDQSDAKFSKRNNSWWIRSGLIDYIGVGSLTDAENSFFSPKSYIDPFGSRTEVFYYKDYFINLERVIDELNNEIITENFNFRTLGPIKTKDINDNQSEICLDELGMVKAMALMGKDDEADSLQGIAEYTLDTERNLIADYLKESDTVGLRTKAHQLLQKASVRFVYDFDAFVESTVLRKAQSRSEFESTPCKRIPYRPTVIGSISREQHKLAEPDVQLSFEYSDGIGNVVMVKAQAEPGEALAMVIHDDCTFDLEIRNTGDQLRWIGNGRTILNNKGNPVKQYEPYFSVSPFFESAKELVERGFTPVMYYDSIGRLIKTEFPDGSFSKVEFDSWQQRIFDQNDTIKESLWYKNRKDGQLGADQKLAAEKAVKHNGTPLVIHLDTLGRSVLSVSHNKTGTRDLLGRLQPTDDEYYSTQIILDIEGNTQKVIDAKGNEVMSYKYDMLGHRVYENSMDAGERWMLNNTMGNPVKVWDSRDFIFTYEYDELQRPVKMRVFGGPHNFNHLYEVIEYGDRKNQPLAERNTRKQNNLLGEKMVHKDTSGLTTFIKYDFKSNLLESTKRLLQK